MNIHTRSTLLLMPVVLFVNSAFTAPSEPAAIERIRTLYAQTTEDTLVSSTAVRFMRTYSAIGGQTTTVRFIGGEEWPESDSTTSEKAQADPYQRYGTISLRKVVVEYNIGARLPELREYLFDPRTQKLVFALAHESAGTCRQSRFYFDKEQLIRIRTISPAPNCDDGDQQPAATKVYDSGFTQSQRDEASQLQARAREYVRIFEDLVILEKLEKGLKLPVRRSAP